MKYQLSQALRDFGPEELAEGAELALTDIQNIKCTPSAEEEDVLQIRSERASVWLDNKNGELVKTSCSCTSFLTDRYACPHITAALIDYLGRRDGYESMEASSLETVLAERTGTEHPFTPGILRKTDRRVHMLTSLLRTDYVKTKPGTGLKGKKQPLSVTCVFRPGSGSAGVTLKVGPGKKYMIRNLPLLLEAFEKNQFYTFTGKVYLRAGKSEYEPASAEVMTFLSHCCSLQKRAGYSAAGGKTGSRRNDEILLNGSELDQLMKLLDGRTVVVKGEDGSGDCIVDLKRTPGALTMTQQQFGAVLHVPQQELIGNGLDSLYLKEDNFILKLPEEQWELREMLSDFAADSPDIYIQNRDLPSVCMDLMPLIRQEGQLVPVNMDLDQYLPEMPQFEIWLDYPQDGLISCRVFAEYYREEARYNIFDPEEHPERNLAEEYKVRERISSFFTAYEEENHTLFLECDEKQLFVFLTEVIPVLAEFGDVLVSDSMKKLRVRPAGQLSAGVQLNGGQLLLSLESASMETDEMAQILSSYNRKKKYFRLKNGDFIVFSEEEAAVWEAVSETYRTYGRKNPQAMKIPAFRALYINEMLNSRDEVIFQESPEYRTLLSNLRQENLKQYQVPDSLKDILRNYQKDGYRWIRMLKDNGFGGILADDMGLGKTLQVLTFLLSEKEAGKKGDELRTLIISPASLVYNWKKEIEDYTPQLSCAVITGNLEQRKNKIREALESADILITSYDLLKRDLTFYDGVVFANEIIDEAQYIKNQNTQAAKGVRLVDSGFRLALTGTPIENRLSELWSIFDYLMPGFLYQYSYFRRMFEIPAVVEHEEEVLQKIRRMVHPFILRRLKKEVLKDLPDKIEKTVVIGLEGEQRKLYDAFAGRLRMFLEEQSEEEFTHGKIEILAELTRLRQICCGPELFLTDYTGENAKKEACLELVREAVTGGHKVLLFSQFTAVLDELCRALSDEKILWHRIDGSVSKEERMKQVQAFASDDVPVFCISLKAGGTGLTLTAADIVIHYDPWWNAAAQNQATDRTHRIGQNNTVTVYQLIAGQTIEQQIVDLQKSKAKLAEDILTGGGISDIMINKEELLKLL